MNFLRIEDRVREDSWRDSNFVEFQITMMLHHLERVYERQSYTFMMMVGDIGGFNSAVIVVPTLFMSYYSSLMY